MPLQVGRPTGLSVGLPSVLSVVTGTTVRSTATPGGAVPRLAR